MTRQENITGQRDEMIFWHTKTVYWNSLFIGIKAIRCIKVSRVHRKLCWSIHTMWSEMCIMVEQRHSLNSVKTSRTCLGHVLYFPKINAIHKPFSRQLNIFFKCETLFGLFGAGHVSVQKSSCSLKRAFF